MKKRGPFYGQNDQLMHWWVLIHSSLQNKLIATQTNFSTNFGGKLSFILSFSKKIGYPIDLTILVT
jgi:hypothetical protein